MDFKQQIHQVFQRILSLETVPDNLTQSDCENWDSLRHLFLVIEMESLLGISFDPWEIERMKNLHEIEQIIGEKLGNEDIHEN